MDFCRQMGSVSFGCLQHTEKTRKHQNTSYSIRKGEYFPPVSYPSRYYIASYILMSEVGISFCLFLPYQFFQFAHWPPDLFSDFSQFQAAGIQSLQRLPQYFKRDKAIFLPPPLFLDHIFCLEIHLKFPPLAQKISQQAMDIQQVVCFNLTNSLMGNNCQPYRRHCYIDPLSIINEY